MAIMRSLNLFVGQLIGTVGLLIVICLGMSLSFYYTNHSVLGNYATIMNEENEKNLLIQVDLLISMARQAEKSFFHYHPISASKRGWLVEVRKFIWLAKIQKK